MNAFDHVRGAVTRLSLVEELAGLRAVLRVLVFGATKYPDQRWKRQTAHEHIAHAREHMSAWASGLRRDPESGESNLSHACTRLLFAIAVEDRNGQR